MEIDFIDVKPLEILLVEDDDADVILTKKSLEHNRILVRINVVPDGTNALKYLKKSGEYAHVRKPDLIVLDLNLPGKNGIEILKEIKADNDLRHIPVVILTTSAAEEDVVNSYNLGVNCYITKPMDLDQFKNVVQSIRQFWFSIVTLPNKSK